MGREETGRSAREWVSVRIEGRQLGAERSDNDENEDDDGLTSLQDGL